MRVIVVYTLITVLVMAFSFGEALAYDRNNVMLALPFDEGEGNVTKDLSPFGNDGGLRQGPQWVEGKFGKALRFDGVDDYVVIPHSKSFDITDSITIAAWVKLSGSEEQNGIGYIVTKGPLFRSGIYRLYANTNGTFGMNVKRHGDPRREGGPSVAAKPDFGHSFDGEWHHVAGTFDGISLKLYIDGEEKARKEITTGNRKIISKDYDVAIGGWGYRKYRMVEGVIDEVRIYNVALTQQEILTDMFGERVIVESKAVNPSEQFTIDISAHLKENLLHRFSFDLTFDPDVLEVISVKEGSLLGRDGIDATSWQTPTIDNKSGVISKIRCSRTGEESVGDAGVLAIVTFEALDMGSADLTLQNLHLLSPVGEEMKASVSKGSVDVYSHGSTSGVVLDSASKKPIKGAKVEVSKNNFTFGLSAYSGDDGTYTIEGIPVGNFDVTASKADYLSETISDVHIEQGKNTPNINIKITSFDTASTITIPIPPAIGETAPDFTLEDIDGKEVSLSNFKGKPIILNFWDSMSEHCSHQIPHLDELYKKYQDDGLVVIGINREIDHKAVLEFAQSQISYIVLLNGEETFQAYGVTGIPCTYYIDKAGKVRARDVGFPSDGEAQMEQKIIELLGGIDKVKVE